MNGKTPLYLLLALFAFTIFAHEWAELPFEWFVRTYSNALLKNILNAVFLVALLGFGVLFWQKQRNHSNSKTLLWAGIMTVLFSIVCYRYLMPYKSEGIHFIQFGILGFVCMLWVPNVWFSLNMVAFMGILDEIYQYINSNSTYLDFNDMVLNFFGVALGIIFYKLLHKDNRIQMDGWVKNLGYILTVVFVASLLMLLFFDVVSLYREEGAGRSIINAVKGERWENFFNVTNFGPPWHRIKPFEGMIYIVILPLLYLPMSRALDK